MYLKEIELVGFKSFSERTKIPLEPGISCVVGKTAAVNQIYPMLCAGF